MIRFFILFCLEVKRALQALPKLLLGAIVLSCLIGTIAFCATKLLYPEQAPAGVTVDLAVEKTSAMSDFVMNFVGDMESTSDMFQFKSSTPQEAYLRLEKGRTNAIILITDDMMSNILEGTNKPVKVILPDSSDLSALLLRELSKAGADLLSSAQAGIYTITDLYIREDLSDYLQEAYLALDQRNLKYTLTRDHLFRYVSTLATGQVPVSVYYTASGILLFLLLWGTTCAHFLGRESAAFYRQLRCSFVPLSVYLLGKWLAVFAVFTLCFGILMLAVFVFHVLFFHAALSVSFTSALSALLVLLFVSSFVLLIFQTAKTSGSGILLLFLSTVILLFLSGAFIPTAFFPPAFRTFSAILPTTHALGQIAALCMGTPLLSHNLALLFDSLLCYLAGVLLLHRKAVLPS